MPEIPQYQRRVREPENTVQARPPREAIGTLAGGISRLSQAVEGIGEAVAARADLHQKQDRINRVIQLQSKFSDDWRGFLMEESPRVGEDTYGNVERGTKFRDEWLKNNLPATEDVEVGNLIRQKVEATSASGLDSLAALQAKERRAVATKNIYQNKESSKDLVYLNPDDATRAATEFRAGVSALRESGAIGQDEAEDALREGTSEIFAAAIRGVADIDPERALKLLQEGTYNKHLEYGTIRELREEAEKIRDDNKKQADADKKLAEKEAEEALTKARETWELEALDKLRSHALTVKDIRQSPLARTGGTMGPDVKAIETWIKKIEDQAEDPGKFGKTDPALYAELSRRVYTDPENITAAEIYGYQGEGLSTDDTEKLVKALGDDADPMKRPDVKNVLDSIKLDYNNNLFGDKKDAMEATQANIEYMKQLKAFEEWVKANPDANPMDYYTAIMEPVKVRFWKDKLDPARRRREFTGKPTFEKWLQDAREANPETSDEELRRYYENKY